ncbi:protein of unknown function [Shimia sagamensis]|uniref:DUF4864 domain-containing protein n=1 Tax=Shimia sagamensis TaxID=1566352 RepID=A0ABY1PDR0_9RHOB|nr:protein of unknown function [Shimia sagamensis]
MCIRALVWSCALVVATTAMAQEMSIGDVISAQIEAFQNEDVEEAFTYASPKVQNIFRSPRNFGAMVQRGYPMVWQPSDVEFRKQRSVGDLVYQEMWFMDSRGIGYSFIYEMIKVSGAWKINGVFKIKTNEVSA